MDTMEIILSICIGIGLSASCGFRIFIPPLILSIASLSGHIQIAHGFEWIGTYPALIAFAFATILEITAYYIPWLDNLLDSIATPAAIVAGIVMSASVIGGISPFLKWTLAVIAGGGTAGIIQVLTTLTRATSSVATGGLANFLVSTAEAIGSFLMSILAIFLPVLAIMILFVFISFIIMKIASRNKPQGII